ncbi:hypothetical protein LEP1GSC198_3194 [Leptospira kirschneri str. JB]|nr:hypothetical protein LEP1GSC198_3194 [Leptospira kirschneri str. JB]
MHPEVKRKMQQAVAIIVLIEYFFMPVKNETFYKMSIKI